MLFFLWFPLCRGEAGLLVTPMYQHTATFVIHAVYGTQTVEYLASDFY